MKQIRLLLLSLLLTQIGYGQDCSIQKTVSNDVSICVGQSTLITLFNSENLVNYQLRDAFNNNIGSPVIGDGSDINFNVSPGTTTTYNVLSYTVLPICSTDILDTITVTVNNLPSISLLTSNNAQTVCVNNSIVNIQYNINDATSANVVGLPTGVVGNYAAGIFTISGIPSIAGTFNYTVTTTGGCSPADSLGGTITVQSLAVGGNVNDTSGFNPVTVCYSSPSGALNLTGHTGNVVSWEKSTDGGITWLNIAGTSGQTTYNYAGLINTTIFRAIIQNGMLCPVVRSSSVLVNVIPNIKPSPVFAAPATICNGGSSILTSQSGYATSQNLATGGTFNNSNPPGWLVDGCSNCLSAGASNTNPGPFQLSATNGGTYSGINYTATGKFAIANGNFDSVLETPVFSTLGLSTANLQFNHAFNLLAGAWVKVELSTNGGASYDTVLTQFNGASVRTPYSAFPLQTINLNSFIGQPSLRVRFNYHGVGASSWAVDNIMIPDIPVNITTQWVDSSNNVIATGNSYTVSPTVTTVYGVRSTFLINGITTCQSSGSVGTTYVTVTVNPRPTANLGPSQTVCNSTPATLSVALTGTAPWKITYSNGSTSTTVTGINSSPYVFNTPNLVSNTTYTITSVSDAKCSAIASDITNNANVSVLNGTPGNWTGLVGTDWFDCMNWAGGGPNPPTITTDVIIPSGRPNMPNINAGTAKAVSYGGIANARDITIYAAASLTMSNNSMLNIGKDWKNNGLFTPGNATVAFKGSTLNQIQLINSGIKLNETFYNLILDNSGGAKGIILPNNFQLTVANDLTLQSGDLRLTGEAQLVQLGAAANPVAGTGKLYRDQQGKKSSFHYNYWSSPVSNDNVSYNLLGNLKDGTDVITNPFAMTNINFGSGIYFADGVVSNPIKISNRWLYKYASSAPDYWSWLQITNTQNLNVGEGFIMKGCDGTVANSVLQNYVFVGKPNNGDINLNLGANQTYLIGNPYPSALDADQFIKDNIKDGGNAATNKFNGILYFFDHFGGNSHFLAEYEGGYATYSLIGGVVAVSNDPLTANTGVSGTKVPKRYIPVAQSFFVKSYTDAGVLANNPNLSPITGGIINFKNSQRVFCTEASGNSIFFRTDNPNLNVEKDDRQKIRLQFISSTGINRQLLIGTDENATNNFDLGFDAPMIDVKNEDMYWNLLGNKLIIQGVSNFNESQIIPLTIKTENQGEVAVKITNLENIDNSKEIYLHDEITGLSHNLRETEFRMLINPGEFANRFSIRFARETLSVNENLLNNSLTVFYSEKDNSLNIFNDTDANLKEVQVYNLLGQRVSRSELENVFRSTIKVPLKNLNESTYIVKVITDNGNTTKKIIIN